MARFAVLAEVASFDTQAEAADYIAACREAEEATGEPVVVRKSRLMVVRFENPGEAAAA